MNVPLKNTPIEKAMLRLQKEQHEKLKSVFNNAYAIAKNCHPFNAKFTTELANL